MPNIHTISQYIKNILKLFLIPIRYYAHTRFTGFRKQYITDLPPLRELTKIKDKYDLFVTGSDQVFNPRITGFDDNYFLSFSSDISKNVSYAASFGFEAKDLSLKEKTFICKNLKHLKHLSVREQKGAEIIRAVAGRPTQVHIDPTLLLTQTQWQPLTKLPVREHYVLLYLMHKDKDLINFAQRLATAKGCELLYISSMPDIKNRVPAKHLTPTPQEWLGLFAKAEYVVTNSFHGLAFSINFNKTFFVGKLPASWPANSRLDNLLNITNLHSRIYTDFAKNYDAIINWTSVNKILEDERQKALSYLQEITHEKQND